MLETSHATRPLDTELPVRAENPAGGDLFRFRDYLLVPGRRALLKRGEPVEIGGRAFDLLHVLVRSQGRVVQKREIFDFVWPAMMVDESNLRFQVACLRRALGSDRDVVTTVQGRGYMFATGPEMLTLPQDIAHRSPPADDARPGGQRSGGRPPIAVIEDDAATLEALDGLLRSSGMAPVCFASSEAFLDSEAGRNAHCLVLDVCLPGRSGLDFHSDMQRAGVDMPVIFISGHADVPMSVRAMKAGAVEFLTKPVRHEELIQAVSSAITQRAA